MKSHGSVWKSQGQMYFKFLFGALLRHLTASWNHSNYLVSDTDTSDWHFSTWEMDAITMENKLSANFLKNHEFANVSWF